jgi:hypothetical protein
MLRTVTLLAMISCVLAVEDTLTVDAATNTLVVKGTAPATPATGEVRIGGGQVKAGNVVITRETQAGTNEAVRGDDPRLVNAVGTGQVGVANGVASLDSNGKIPTAQLPAGIGGLLWGKIQNATPSTITTASSTVLLNRLHTVQDVDPGNQTVYGYDIAISGLSPAPGDVLGFTVPNYDNARGLYRLNTNDSAVRIAGRPQYLTLTNTNVVLLMWDSANWLPLVLQLDSPWSTDNNMKLDITCTSGNPPTKNANPEKDNLRWARVGSSILISFDYYQTGNGTAGSSEYLFKIPVGSIDTTIAPLVTHTGSDTTRAAFGFGHMRCRSSGNGNAHNAAFAPYSATHLRAATTDSIIANDYKSLSGSYVRYNGTVQLPMKDW